jgi:hypothetical protein
VFGLDGTKDVPFFLRRARHGIVKIGVHVPAL